MNFGDLRPSLGEIIRLLKQISRNSDENSCCVAITSAGQNISIPAGFGSVSIVQTSSAGSVDITMSDGSTFILTGQGQTYVVAAPQFETLQAFPISGSGTWQWSAIK